MYSILLIIEKPVLKSPEQRNINEEDQYSTAITNIRRLINTDTEIQALGENVLLIPINNTLDELSDAVQRISGAAYSYIVLTEDMNLQSVEAFSMMKP